MKRLSILLVCFWVSFTALPQSGVKTNHYLLPEFEKALVLMNDGKTYPAVMNYNMVTEEMVYDQNGKMLALDKIENIDTVYLSGMKFIPAGKRFYEVAYLGPVSLYIQHKINLSPAGKPAGYGGTTQTSAVTTIKNWSSVSGIYELKLSEDYITSDATLNWINFRNEWHNFINERQLTRILPDKKEEIRKFVKSGDLNFKKKEDLIKLMRFLNRE